MLADSSLPCLFIRADASAHMGSGHVTRCLALGQTWQAQGGIAAFLSHCESDALRRRIESAGIDFIPLDKPHPDPSDLQIILMRLGERVPGRAQRPWLVLDGYHFDPTYQHAVRARGCRLLVIDDTAHLPNYSADVLLNQNINAERLTYRYGPDTLVLLGTRYALLRPEFLSWRDWHREISRVARKVLVTLGGSDPDNATLKVLRALEQANVEGLEAVVIVGANSPHYETLQAAAHASQLPIRLKHYPPDMCELMAWADVAISGAGSTCWELAFMGLPSLILVLAENQWGVAEGLSEMGVAVNLGWFEQATAGRIAAELAALGMDQGKRRELSHRGQQLVNGHGAESVVAVMRGLDASVLNEDRLQFRKAAVQDSIQIWRISNDPTVRMNSFNQDPIPLHSHLEWYRGKLSSPDTRIWVLEIGGAVVAQVRYERVAPDTVEVNFSVAAAFRGKGLGTRALALTSQSACQEMAVKRVRGLMLKENSASVRAFEKAGFKQVDEVERSGHGCYVFERTCP